jgi:hypothetical protein
MYGCPARSGGIPDATMFGSGCRYVWQHRRPTAAQASKFSAPWHAKHGLATSMRWLGTVSRIIWIDTCGPAATRALAGDVRCCAANTDETKKAPAGRRSRSCFFRRDRWAWPGRHGLPVPKPCDHPSPDVLASIQRFCKLTLPFRV